MFQIYPIRLVPRFATRAFLGICPILGPMAAIVQNVPANDQSERKSCKRLPGTTHAGSIWPIVTVNIWQRWTCRERQIADRTRR